jgi:hypothetical protein
MDRPSAWVRIGVLAGLVGALPGCRIGPLPPVADIGKTQIAHAAYIEGDDRSVSAIMATFHHADEALRKLDLDELMTLYAQGYKYQGLTRDSLRRIWEDLFRDHDHFTATHVFSRIVVHADQVPPTAEVTCTGSLWANSRSTGRRVNIDSWYEEVHYLIYEDGAWRVRGHAWETPKSIRPIPWPHPFF